MSHDIKIYHLIQAQTGTVLLFVFILPSQKKKEIMIFKSKITLVITRVYTKFSFQKQLMEM